MGAPTSTLEIMMSKNLCPLTRNNIDFHCNMINVEYDMYQTEEKYVAVMEAPCCNKCMIEFIAGSIGLEISTCEADAFCSCIWITQSCFVFDRNGDLEVVTSSMPEVETPKNTVELVYESGNMLYIKDYIPDATSSERINCEIEWKQFRNKLFSQLSETHSDSEDVEMIEA